MTPEIIILIFIVSYFVVGFIFASASLTVMEDEITGSPVAIFIISMLGWPLFWLAGIGIFIGMGILKWENKKK